MLRTFFVAFMQFNDLELRLVNKIFDETITDLDPFVKKIYVSKRNWIV